MSYHIEKTFRINVQSSRSIFKKLVSISHEINWTRNWRIYQLTIRGLGLNGILPTQPCAICPFRASPHERPSLTFYCFICRDRYGFRNTKCSNTQRTKDNIPSCIPSIAIKRLFYAVIQLVHAIYNTCSSDCCS